MLATTSERLISEVERELSEMLGVLTTLRGSSISCQPHGKICLGAIRQCYPAFVLGRTHAWDGAKILLFAEAEGLGAPALVVKTCLETLADDRIAKCP